MNSWVKTTLMLVLAVGVALPLAAADKERKKKKEKAGPLANVLKQIEKAEPNEEQSKQLKELTTEYEGKVSKAREKLGSAARELAEARKKASGEGKKGKELQEAVESSVNLTDEQKAALDESNKLTAEFRQKAIGLLTPEQREKAGLKIGKGKKRKQ